LQVWPLWSAKDKLLRVVVINKRPSDALNVTLEVDKAGGFGPATVTRLLAPGPNPLEAKTGITLGGVYFDDNAVKAGKPSSEHALRVRAADGNLSWNIYMPPASAALVEMLRLF
jgi:hypothetical protein